MTLREKVPAGAEEDAVRVKVDDALLPAGGVTLVGENVAVTPLGSPVMLRLTALLKLFKLVIFTVDDALLPIPPAVTDNELGVRPMVKSFGGGGAATVSARLAL